MSKGKKMIKNDEDNIQLHNPEIRRKSFKKGVKARERPNKTKVRLFAFIAKKMIISKKDSYKRQQDKEKKKDKKINQAGVVDSGIDDVNLLNVVSAANNGGF